MKLEEKERTEISGQRALSSPFVIGSQELECFKVEKETFES